MTFTPDVYEQIREGAIASARMIVPFLHDLVSPQTVIDVGCGEGWFAREFAAHRCRVFALDESVEMRLEWTPTGRIEDGVVVFMPADLTGDAWAGPDVEADLAVCLEVAEHLPDGAADAFVATLCALAPVVAFSAAIPGQGGHGHLNEQWPDYWASRFEANGFRVSGAFRWLLWGNDQVEPWYQQNLLVAVHPERCPRDTWNVVASELFGPTVDDRPLRVVHPAFYESRVGERDTLAHARDGVHQDAEWARECLTNGGYVGGRSTRGGDRALTYIERIEERTR